MTTLGGKPAALGSDEAHGATALLECGKPGRQHLCRGISVFVSLIDEAWQFAHTDKTKQQQGFVQFLDVLRARPHLVAHPRNGRRVECRQIPRGRSIQPAATVHCLGASLLKRRIVEESVGIGVQDL